MWRGCVKQSLLKNSGIRLDSHTPPLKFTVHLVSIPGIHRSIAPLELLLL